MDSVSRAITFDAVISWTAISSRGDRVTISTGSGGEMVTWLAASIQFERANGVSLSARTFDETAELPPPSFSLSLKYRQYRKSISS